MRRLLDMLYKIGGGLAACAILAICLIVTAQVCLNILARIGGPDLSFTIPSYADFAGFALAGATFLALAHTLRSGGHIRVNLVTDRLPLKARWVMEMLALALSTAISGCAAWFAGKLMEESLRYGDTSTGIVPIPLWIPQAFMVAGLVLLTVALLDTLAQSIAARAPVITDDTSE